MTSMYDDGYWNLKNFKMDQQNLKSCLLGRGSYASVYKVRHKESHKYYAIKSVI